MDKYVIRNKANGKESIISKELWERLTDQAKRPFSIKVVTAPQEVLDMESGKSETNQDSEAPIEGSQVAEKSNETENTANTTTTKKRAPKKAKNNTGNNN